MKVLVTAGATREPLDAVRFFSNVSTGRTGTALAVALARLGHEVTLLRSEGTEPPADRTLPATTFSSAADLQNRLQRQLAAGRYGAVIMTAAVADYRPESPVPGKLDSAAPELTLRLVRNAKILPQLRGFSPAPLCVIGFKLTAGATTAARQAAVAAQFAAGGVDAVVHNDLAEIRAATAHPFHFFTAASRPPRELSGAAALAGAIDAHLRGISA
jgi:phosphopantothenoylcysteine decarboxylase/phosphopantothenate--cysteine ligase